MAMAMLKRTKGWWSLRLTDEELAALTSMVVLEVGNGWADDQRAMGEEATAAAGERLRLVLSPPPDMHRAA